MQPWLYFTYKYLSIFSSSSMHCFEGPDWIHLKRGRECFSRGPLVKVDPLGRCAAILVYGLQMIVLKAAEVLLLIHFRFITSFSIRKFVLVIQNMEILFVQIFSLGLEIDIVLTIAALQTWVN